MPQQNTPDPRHGATHSMEHADRAHSDISAKISRLTWGMGEDDARRMAGPMLLASAYAEIDRLKSDMIKLRNELSCERGDCERALAIVDSVKAELGDQDLEGEDIWAAVQELRERAEAGS